MGVSPAVADMLLPQVGTRLMRDYPHVSVESRLLTASEILDLLRAQEIDLGIAYARSLRLEETLQVEHLYHDEASWLVRRGHPILKKRRGSLMDFSRYPLVMQHLPLLYREWLKSIELAVAAATPGATVHLAHMCSDYDLLYRMTLDSDAILAIPAKTAVNSVYAKKLQKVDMPMGPPPVEFATAHLRVPRPSPLALKFMAYMQEEVAALAREDHP